MAIDVEEEKTDLLRTLVNQKVNRIQDSIERAMKEDMHKEIEKHNIEMHVEIS